MYCDQIRKAFAVCEWSWYFSYIMIMHDMSKRDGNIWSYLTIF